MLTPSKDSQARCSIQSKKREESPRMERSMEPRALTRQVHAKGAQKAKMKKVLIKKWNQSALVTQKLKENKQKIKHCKEFSRASNLI